jgi:hypothetical protein
MGAIVTVMKHPHNFGRICLNGCQNYHIAFGDSACNVTGKRLTTTKIQVIYEVGCASYLPSVVRP